MRSVHRKWAGILTILLMLTMLFSASSAAIAATPVYLATTAGQDQYTTLAAAVDAVDDGGTIVLLEDVTETDVAGVTISKDITFDTGGFRYTVTSADTYCLYVDGGSFTTIGAGSFNSDSISVVDGSITMTGSIDSSKYEADGVYAENAQVIYTGDISATGENSKGIQAGNSAVTITGNITGQIDGITLYDSSVAHITGNITGLDDDAVDAYDSKATIIGNLKGEYGVYSDLTEVDVTGTVDAVFMGILVYDSTITVTGNITVEYTGMSVSNSTILVNGDVKAGMTGVSAAEDSIVTINGDVKAVLTGVSADEDSIVTINGNIESEVAGVSAGENCKVTISGNITVDGFGVVAEATGEVIVGGNVSAKEIGIAVLEYDIYYESDEHEDDKNFWDFIEFLGISAFSEPMSLVNAGAATQQPTVYIKGSVTTEGYGVVCMQGGVVKIDGTLTAPQYVSFVKNDLSELKTLAKADGVNGTGSNAGYVVYQYTALADNAMVLIKGSTASTTGVAKTNDTNLTMLFAILMLLSGAAAVFAAPKLACKARDER